MDIEYVLCVLQELYDESSKSQAWYNSGEQSKFRLMLEELLPEHRDFIIELRDQALAAGAFEWAVVLSHTIYCMADPQFYGGKFVELSTN